MDRVTLMIIDLEIRRTEALFRKGRAWMALMLGGSALAVLAGFARIAAGH